MRLLISISVVLLMVSTISSAQSKSNSNRALLLIDIQDFYFPGGSTVLVNAEMAADKASKVLQVFRDNGNLVIHVKHHVKAGGDIHQSVTPLSSEMVIVKKDVNAFKNTDLKDYLQQHTIEEIVIIGMQTHMCLEAAVRAAADYGFKVTVVDGACTTRDLQFNDTIIPAMQVHYSTLATLKSYAEIISFEDFEKKFLN